MSNSGAAQVRTTSSYIAQGESSVGSTPGMIISTILGSCVATCLWDPLARIGGMNHILLPEGADMQNGYSSFGAHSMELLINAMIKEGADRRRFRAKIFGGAVMRAGLSDAGSSNGSFVLDYLQREGIPLDGQSLGGNLARRVEFWPEEGRARQKFVTDHVPAATKPVEPIGDLDLF